MRVHGLSISSNEKHPMTNKLTASQIAQWCQGRIDGPEREFSGLESMDLAQADQLTFAGHGAYAKKLASCPAAGALVTEDVAAHVQKRPDQTIIYVKNADLAVAAVLDRIAPPWPLPDVGIHPTAIVDPKAQLGKDLRVGPHVVIQAGAIIGDRCSLMANVFIGAQAVLGEDCILWPNVVIRDRCTIGRRVICHPGVVIGADGFGYRFSGGKHIKIPQIGTVEIGDDCELGANTCVDRGKFSATIIGAGSKLDNLVQIGHNVRLGQHSILAGQVGVAGSTRAGDYLVVGGGSGLGDHLTLGTAVQVAGSSAVTSDAPDGAKLVGTPAQDAKGFFSSLRVVRSLPKVLERLEQRITELERTAKDHRP